MFQLIYNIVFSLFEGIDMLYLMRKQDESIIINNNIELKIVEIKGKYVKLGFDFPKEASVLRKELHDKIQAENKLASENQDVDVLNSINLNDSE
jgi:carbon storage regulator